jgi:hypothetical protein
LAPATKYFTYQPKPVSNAPLGQGSLANQPMSAANTLQLKPGQVAKFAAGKGWYGEDIPAAKSNGSFPVPSTKPATNEEPNPNLPAGGGPAVSGSGNAPAGPAPYDMDNAIATDWETIQAKADADKLTGDAAAAFQRQIRQAYIDYGGAGEDLGDWSQYIDPATVAAAKANKFSTMALDRRGYDQSSAQAKAEMAARGGLGSGDTVNALQNLLFNREQADYGGLRTFQGGAVSGFNNLNTIGQQARDMIRTAHGNAAARAAAAAPTVDTTTDANGNTTMAGGTTPPPAASGAYKWDTTVGNLAQLNAWLKARGKTLAQFKVSNPAAYAKLAAQ